MVYVYGDYTNFGSLNKAFEDLGIKILKASLQRIPNTPQEFTEDQLNDIETLIDKLEEDDDVQGVFTNVA